jgi:hypothetical protein
MTATADDTPDDAPDDGKESKQERRLRKEAERLSDSRPLESWERYRALGDHIDHLLDVVELADRKTRFALLILGTLNAANILIAVRADSLGADVLNQTFIRLYVTCYVLLSLYFFIYAIVALKPRMRQLRTGYSAAPADSRGLRMIDDILGQDVDHYYDSWRQAQIGQLNREMATHAYLLASITAEKFLAVNRVYVGLYILVILTAVLIAVIGLHLSFPTRV